MRDVMDEITRELAELERRVIELEDRLSSVAILALNIEHATEKLNARLGRALFLKPPKVTIVDAINYVDARVTALEGSGQDATRDELISAARALVDNTWPIEEHYGVACVVVAKLEAALRAAEAARGK